MTDSNDTRFVSERKFHRGKNQQPFSHKDQPVRQDSRRTNKLLSTTSCTLLARQNYMLRHSETSEIFILRPPENTAFICFWRLSRGAALKAGSPHTPSRTSTGTSCTNCSHHRRYRGFEVHSWISNLHRRPARYMTATAMISGSHCSDSVVQRLQSKKHTA